MNELFKKYFSKFVLPGPCEPVEPCGPLTPGLPFDPGTPGGPGGPGGPIMIKWEKQLNELLHSWINLLMIKISKPASNVHSKKDPFVNDLTFTMDMYKSQ